MSFRITLLFAWCVWMALLCAFTVPWVDGLQWNSYTVTMAALWISGPAVALTLSVILFLFRRPASQFVTRIIAAHFGVCLLISLSVLLAPWAARLVMSALFAAMLDWPILVLRDERTVDRSGVGLIATILLLIVGPLAAVFLGSSLNAEIVEWRALASARTNPYCLLVPWKDEAIWYRQVGQWADLRSLTMQTPYGGLHGDHQFGFHAVLLIQAEGKSEFYNWSYAAQDFLPLSDFEVSEFSFVDDSCKPSTYFFATLQ